MELILLILSIFCFVSLLVFIKYQYATQKKLREFEKFKTDLGNNHVPIIITQRPPTIKDNPNLKIGTLWLDECNGKMHILTKIIPRKEIWELATNHHEKVINYHNERKKFKDKKENK